ncbi:MAG: hypothetical protein QOJ80_3450, partial [Mycobacterium sp.]|nr:hypothetical protein [Mycobacterium sp.]
MTVGAMSFLPFVRSGLANRITSLDHDHAVLLRATAAVTLELRGVPIDGTAPQVIPINRDVELVGPGDIVGLDSRAIVRTEPRAGVTNFEPNYLAFVEFYDEDLPWRYTPAAADPASPHRLRPWLTLLVLNEDEFTDAPYQATRALPAVEMKPAAASAFPPADDMAGWAHVHYNGALVDPLTVKSSDGAAVAAALQAAVAANPDIACSRLLCPRKFEPNVVYHAFLIPTFESGRLAGLGLDPAATPNATHSAWDDYPSTASQPKADGKLHPFYHRFYFRTGGPGDFEYLVRLLKPRPADHRVGRRDLDTQTPGWGLSGVTNLGGSLKLGGALRVPPASLPAAEKMRYDLEEAWDTPYPHTFQNDLARFVNLSDAYTVTAASPANHSSGLASAANDPDPMVTPPIYGCWHALTQRLLYTRDGATAPNNRNWLHALNLDPRYRVAAGLGTAVIQKDQEDLMRGAWAQVGDVIAANRIIRLSQLSAAVSYAAYDRSIAPLVTVSPERALMVTAPVQARVMTSGVTVRHHVCQSATPVALMSAPMRRIARPGGA